MKRSSFICPIQGLSIIVLLFLCFQLNAKSIFYESRNDVNLVCFEEKKEFLLIENSLACPTGTAPTVTAVAIQPSCTEAISGTSETNMSSLATITITEDFSSGDYSGGSPVGTDGWLTCLLYTSPSPRDRTRSRMPSSA